MAKRYSVVTVRMDGELHQRLKHCAAVEAVRRRDQGFSLNRLCLEALELHERNLAEQTAGEIGRMETC